jgi:hypothetical protein
VADASVVATVDGLALRTSIVRMSGPTGWGVSTARRAEGSLEAGGVYDLAITLDTAPWVVEGPIELAERSPVTCRPRPHGTNSPAARNAGTRRR